MNVEKGKGLRGNYRTEKGKKEMTENIEINHILKIEEEMAMIEEMVSIRKTTMGNTNNELVAEWLQVLQESS